MGEGLSLRSDVCHFLYEHFCSVAAMRLLKLGSQSPYGLRLMLAAVAALRFNINSRHCERSEATLPHKPKNTPLPFLRRLGLN